MTEAILIEIAQRFRVLEDAADDPELYTEDHLSSAHPNAHERLESALEACRDDMNRMADEIRKGLR